MGSESSQVLGKLKFQNWVYASKMASWPKIILPAMLGQAVGACVAGDFNWWGFLVPTGFSVAGLLFIVFMNDWGDTGVDKIKRKMFPAGCSPKTIPDGLLTSKSVLFFGVLMGGLAFLWGLGGLLIQRPWLPELAAGGLFLFYSYTFPPLKLNYRGGGEILEMLGVGMYLPYLNAYGQSGELWSESYLIFSGFLGLSFASALASGLSDEESDRAGGKNTFTTWIGNRRVRRMVNLLVYVTPLVWFFQLITMDFFPSWIFLIPAFVLACSFFPLSRFGKLAGTGEFFNQNLYKKYLHLGIWGSTLIWALEFYGLLILS